MEGELNPDSNRVVISDMAAATCLSTGVEGLLRQLRKGFNYSEKEDSDSAQPRRFRRFAKVSHDCSNLFRKTRLDSRLARYLVAAVDLDLGNRLCALGEAASANLGVVIGNFTGNCHSYCSYFLTATREGYDSVNPIHFPTTLLNYPTIQLNNAFSLQGSSTTTSSGFSAGLDAIGYAFIQLKLGKEQILLGGGIEEINDINIGYLERDNTISQSGVIRPFHKNRDGTVPGEGVGVLMLETIKHAEAGGRTGLCEIKAYRLMNGLSDDSESIFLKNATETIKHALADAKIRLGEIDAIFPSASGSQRGDELEGCLLRETFASHLCMIPIYPVKSIIGECFTAAGPLQCIAATHSLRLTNGSIAARDMERNTGDLNLPERLRASNNALIYSLGPDKSFSVLILSRCAQSLNSD